MDALWHTLQGPFREYAGRLLGATFILGVGWLALRLVGGALGRLMERGRVDPSVTSFLANSLRTALLVVVILGVLQQLGVETTSLLTLLGTAALAVALSLQGSLANFASGLLILSFRMVRIGDLIELGDVRGRVLELLPFHVVLVTLDNQRITVPNTLLTNGPVRNNSALPTRRVQWTLSLPLLTELEPIKAALRERLRADTRILSDPAPQLFVQEWSTDKRVLAVTAWTATADYLAVQQEGLEILGKIVEAQRPPSS